MPDKPDCEDCVINSGQTAIAFFASEGEYRFSSITKKKIIKFFYYEWVGGFLIV